MHHNLSILVVDDDDEFRASLSSSLKALRADILEASNCPEALRIYRELRPKVVFVDINMPDMNGLEFSKIVTSEDPAAVVAVITGFAGEQLVVDAIRSGASEFLRKPISSADLKASAARLAVLSDRKRQRIFDLGTIEQATLSFRLPSRAVSVGPCVKQIMSILRGFVERDRLPHFELAIHEALWNAYEHGNLGIRCEEKKELCENDLLETALRQREVEAVKLGRFISVEVAIDQDKFVCSVEDQGPGFDWQDALAKDIGEAQLTSLHGRGLLLIRSVFDGIEYNDSGSRLTMVKHLRK